MQKFTAATARKLPQLLPSAGNLSHKNTTHTTKNIKLAATQLPRSTIAFQTFIRSTTQLKAYPTHQRVITNQNRPYHEIVTIPKTKIINGHPKIQSPNHIVSAATKDDSGTEILKNNSIGFSGRARNESDKIPMSHASTDTKGLSVDVDREMQLNNIKNSTAKNKPDINGKSLTFKGINKNETAYEFTTDVKPGINPTTDKSIIDLTQDKPRILTRGTVILGIAYKAINFRERYENFKENEIKRHETLPFKTYVLSPLSNTTQHNCSTFQDGFTLSNYGLYEYNYKRENIEEEFIDIIPDEAALDRQEKISFITKQQPPRYIGIQGIENDSDVFYLIDESMKNEELLKILRSIANTPEDHNKYFSESQRISAEEVSKLSSIDW